jgi:23S rRNA (cytidine2498-2'-O)-methyltransferase
MATKRPPRAVPTDADLYLGGPHVIDVLIDELRQLGARDPVEVAPGIVAVRPIAASSGLLDPALARQAMPHAHVVTGSNANDLAATILDRLAATTSGVVLVEGDVEVTVPEMERRGSNALEEHPLEAARIDLDAVLRAKVTGRRAKRGDTAPSTGHRLRVLLVDAWSAWVSVAPAPVGPALLSWPSPFPGGRALDERAANAPSSAHRKLDEALAWLDTAPSSDDVVLDLGAAPGGWSWAALRRGARVIAVDRADMDPEIVKHERLEHVRADAFKYVPERQPTWLLCDVIAEPERSLEVVARAVQSTALRALVVTLKLKRPVKLDVIKRARALCRTTPGFFGRTKSLAANKLEVTVMMRRT